MFAIPIRYDSYGVLFAVAVVTTWLLLRSRRTTRPQPLPASPAVSNAPPRVPEQWQVALQEFTRDAEARLMTRAGILQQLLAEADERIAHLKQVLDDSASRSTIPSQKMPISLPAKATLAGPHFAASQTARNAAVFAMADAGNTAAAIARELGTPIGEIELILSLRSRNTANG